MAFNGSARFELVGTLGEGGMGVVYEAYDRQREMRVALKLLRNITPGSLYRFKREFRALSDFSHPNIVGLYELVSEGDDWFFTMELIDGVDLVTYVRPAGWAPLVRTTRSTPDPDDRNCTTMPTRVGPVAVSDAGDGAGGVEEPAAPAVEFAHMADEEKLRDGLVQLATALDALHRIGIIHRDLKPSNVMVTREGRVVLMDFGIVAETAGAGLAREAKVVGTPAFMAPEQAAGQSVTPAADWYAYGVILYMMLTGRLPFSGGRNAVLLAKQKITAPLPTTLATSIPEDLAALSARLLSRRAQERPCAGEVLKRLGVSTGVVAAVTDTTTLGGRQAFVGRDRELAALHAGYAAMRAGETVSTFCIGVSGMGKSTLVRRFLNEVEARSGQDSTPIVLRGRCHERESLPYKALDTVVDNLMHLLLGAPADRVEQLLPDDVDQLTRLFPVLRRVPGVSAAPSVDRLDPHQQRVRAFASLRELLCRLTSWRPVVIYIDDLQWADHDSLQLLHDVLRGPGAPRLMLVASVRAENVVEGDARADDVVAMMEQFATRHRSERVAVGPLSEGEQDRLVAELLGDGASARVLSGDRRADSGGSPFFIGELVRYLQEVEGTLDGVVPNLDDAIWQRVCKLPEPAQQLLQVVAVVGEPTSSTALSQAIDMAPVDSERAVAMLCASHLARVARQSQDRWLTTYHDRVRETVCARLPEARTRALHAAIARTLERLGQGSVDALARHWLAAGEPLQASGYLVAAADAAASKLAFSRAADLYSEAMALGVHSDVEERALRCKMAEALGTAGRCYEAATAYQQAAARAQDPEAVTELTRLAADNMLRSGHIVEGLHFLGEVMDDLGISLKSSPTGALMSLGVQRSRIFLRGYRYRPRPVAAVAAADLSRIDTLYSASSTLGMIDHIRGADVQTRHLLEVLRSGEEGRVARALGIEAVFRASFGGRNAPIARRLSHQAMEIADRVEQPLLVAVTRMVWGAVEFFGGDPQRASEAFAAAEHIWRTQCVGADWERITANYFHCQAQMQLGELGKLARSVDRFLEEAARRSDVYARNLFKTQPSIWRWLSEDDPERALREVASATEGWPEDRYYVAHHFQVMGTAIATLYQGRYAEASDLIQSAIRKARKAMIWKVRWLRSEAYALLGRCALEVGDTAGFSEAAKFLETMELTYARGVGAGLRGVEAARAGDDAEARRLLQRAVDTCERAHYLLFRAAFRYRLGEVTPGQEGEQIRSDAAGWLAERGCRNPMGLIALYAPSCRPAPTP